MKTILLYLISFFAVVSFFSIFLINYSWTGDKSLIHIALSLIPIIYLFSFPFLLSIVCKKSEYIKN